MRMTVTLLALALLLLTTTSLYATVDASLIGFDSAFTNAASPFAITECDVACTSPASVTLQLKLVRTGVLTATDTVYVSTRATSNADRLAATADTDYSSLNQFAVSFAPSEATKIVTLSVISDGVYEEDEYFEAILDNPSSGVTLPSETQVAYLKIQDSGDAGIFAFSASTYTFSEGADLVQVKVVRNGGASGTVRVTYRLANPTQATAISTKSFLLTDSIYQLTFSENQREAFIPIKIIQDSVYESKEFFYLELSALAPAKASDPKASVAKFGTQKTAVVFIADDGDAGQFDFTAPFIFCREDNGSAVVSIARSLGSSTSSYTPVTLLVSTVGQSGGSNATEGESLAFDYFATSDKLKWANGETRKTFSIKVFNNNKYDQQTRAFKVRMTTAEGGATVGPNSEMWVYIVDDRDAGTLSFKQASYDVSESGGSVTVEVIRTGLVDPTGVNTYSSGAIAVDIATYGGTIKPGLGKYELDSDNGVVKQRKCTHSSPCTALADVGYTSLASTTISFADGETLKTITIPIINDDLYEAPDQVFKVVLQNAIGGAHIGIDYEHPSEWIGYGSELLALDKRRNDLPDNVGTIVTIKDDGDPAVLVSKASLSVSEIGQTDAFEIWLNSNPSGDVTITIAFDATAVDISPATLTFTTANWGTRQSVVVAAVDNHRTQGLPVSELRVSATSTDPAYNSPLRSSFAGTGFVLGSKIYTQLPGVYATGNKAHAFPWAESAGVMTSPAANDALSVFVFDDDPVGVQVKPEASRHQSNIATGSPFNHVAVRRDGHSAIVGIALTSEPAGDVVVSFEVDEDAGVQVLPAQLTFTTQTWNVDQTIDVIAIASSRISIDQSVTRCVVRVHADSTTDSFYAKPSETTSQIFVARFPPAQVLMNAQVLETWENHPVAGPARYSIRLGSEPMHWEPIGTLGYKPSEITIKATADTALTLSSDSPVAVAAGGSVTSIAAASNSSTSTPASLMTRIGVVRFPVHPGISTQTGSHQVGSAKLRLFRLSGGENGGLGGIVAGAVVAEGSLADSWDESSLRAVCASGLSAGIECTLRQTSPTTQPLSALFPNGEFSSNISFTSAGETTISPTGTFDEATNAYIPSTGWVEIDVTVTLNAFLARQHELEMAKLPFEGDLTFLVYTKSPSIFVFNGVTEVVFASKEAKDASVHPRLAIRGSGRINLSLAAETSVSQSHSGSAKAAIDGKLTSKLGVASTFAMGSVAYKYPWWQANLGAVRLIEEVVVTIKKKVSSAAFSASQLPISVRLMLSDVSLSTNNQGLTGLTAALSKSLYTKQFNITSRSFTADENDNIVLRWRVFGAQGDALFDSERYVSNYSATVEAQYFMLQVDGENNIALNEVQIYQPPLASARVSIGGHMPSSSVIRKGKNQIQFDLGQVGDPDPAGCDQDTEICRHELLFTSGDWWQDQEVRAQVVDDDVATGDRDVILSHAVISEDPSFNQDTDSLFNESHVKTLRVHDDDEVAVLLSTSTLEIEEGSGVYPNAPVLRQGRRVVPVSVRCSSALAVVFAVDKIPKSCAVAFIETASSSWDVCIVNPSAPPLADGSAWMMAGFSESDINVTSITLTIPKMQGAKYVKAISLWWTDVHDTGSASALDLLNISNAWTKIDSYTVTMLSSGEQTLTVDGLGLASIKSLLVALDESYDDAKGCVVAPHVSIQALVAVPFPLDARGDLTHEDSVPPALSGRSRMHQFGKTASLGVRLASEPIEDVVISIVAAPSNSPVIVYDAMNRTSTEEVQDLVGGQYESGEIVKFTAATALRFTPENWNTTQELTFMAVDDNWYNANRTFSISHKATSADSTASEVPTQVYETGQVKRSFTTLASALTYGMAPFIVTASAAATWPRHRIASWTSATGTVQVFVIDDDLPGVTLSHSTVVVSESAIDPANYSVALDSAPTSSVVVTISYPADASLLSVSPLQLTFTTTNWREPQFVFIDPVANDVYDAGAPLTIGYDRLIAKKTQPVLQHTVSSADAVYDKILVGTNERDTTLGYVASQGVVAVIQDDDTGCPKEYECANGGVCVDVTYGGARGKNSASVCRCPSTFGMKNCGATCANARDCEFSRVEIRIQCRPSDVNAVCGHVFDPARLATTLYRMLTTNEFRSASGTTFSKLSLGAMEDVMYIANSTAISCVDASSTSATCVNVVVDLKKEAGSASNAMVEKLQGFLEAGSLQSQPVFAELMTSTQQFPESIGATVAVWVFLGFCLASVGGAAALFTLRHFKVKKFHVRPQLDEDPADESDAMLSPHNHAQ